MYPNAFEDPGMLKSFISLFMITPVSGTMTVEPKRRLIVVVREIAMPDLSAVTTWDVPGVSRLSRPPGLYSDMLRVRPGLIFDLTSAATASLSMDAWYLSRPLT